MTLLKILFLLLIIIPFVLFLLFIIDRIMDDMPTREEMEAEMTRSERRRANRRRNHPHAEQAAVSRRKDINYAAKRKRRKERKQQRKQRNSQAEH